MKEKILDFDPLSDRNLNKFDKHSAAAAMSVVSNSLLLAQVIASPSCNTSLDVETKQLALCDLLGMIEIYNDALRDQIWKYNLRTENKIQELSSRG